MAAQAACHDKCNLVCAQDDAIVASCYTACRAMCSDDDTAARAADHAPAHQYASVALSPKSLIYGYSYGRHSRAEAETIALDSCAKAPGKPRDCKVQLSFRDTCGSLAVKPNSGEDDGVWGTDWATDKMSAEKMALSYCSEIAGVDCRTEITFCARR